MPSILLIKNVFAKQKVILKNVASLSALNALNYLAPFITLPYIVRIVGAEKFGAISFALVIAQYLMLISNYGFPYSATREVSMKRTNKVELNKIFSAVLIIRLFFSIFLTILYIVLILTIPSLKKDSLLYFYSVGIPLGSALLPVWYFQGLEKMNYILYSNVFPKILLIGFTFLLIKDRSDYVYVPLLHSLTFGLSGVIGASICFLSLKSRLVMPSYSYFMDLIKNGWHIFISTIGINLYRNANIFILGVMTNNLIVGYYSSAEKLIKAVQSLTTPISTALFPALSKKFENRSERENIILLFKIAKPFLLILIIIFIPFVIFPSYLVKLAFGDDFLRSTIDLRIMSAIIIFGGINYVLGVLGVYNLGYKKQFSRFVLISGTVGILTVICLIPFLNDVGAAIALTLSEFLLFILLFIFLIKKYVK